MEEDDKLGAPNRRRRLLRLGCLLLISPCLFWYLIAYSTYAVNRIRWNSANATNYTMEYSDTCERVDSIQLNVVNSKVIRITTRSYQTNQEQSYSIAETENTGALYLVGQGTNQDISMEGRFNEVLQCNLNPTCRVQYNSGLGYPEHISAYFFVIDIPFSPDDCKWLLNVELNKNK